MINILYSGNFAVFDGILSSVISVVKYNKGQINVFILTMDLTSQNANYKPISKEQSGIIEKILKNVNENSSCEVFDLTEAFESDNNISIGKRFTPYALLRLYVSTIDKNRLPNKILYLDADTLVLSSLENLFNTDITNYEFGACKDYFGKVFFGRNYCNSGVLLMNMEKIRETELLERVRKMCVEKKLFLADQTALNKCVTKKLILPPQYNSQRRIKKNTVIRHYCASWRFVPIIRLKTIKQWEVKKVLKDKHNVYNNYKVSEILNEYMKVKRINNV